MLRNELDRALDRAASRLHWQRQLWCGAGLWLVLGASLPLIALMIASAVHRGMLMAVAATATLTVALLVARRPFAPRAVARLIEQTFPDLDGSLLTALDQHPDVTTGELGYFQKQVIYQTLAHSRRSDWRDIVPTRQLAAAATAHSVAAILALACLAGSLTHVPSQAAPPVAALATTEVTDDNFGLVVEPGDTSIERGTPLPVIARFTKRLPSNARLITRGSNGEQTTLDLARHFADPLFGGRLAEVDRSLTYHIEYDGHTSRDYTLTVFELPGVDRIDTVVTFPEWTKLPEVETSDARRVSLVEGAQLTIRPTLNKPVTEFVLSIDGQPMFRQQMRFSADAPVTEKLKSEQKIEVTPLMLFRSKTLRFELTDFDGRKSRDPIEIIVDVVPNRRPDLKLTFPGRDTRVSPLEELTIEGTAWDDFGLVEAGVLVTWIGKPPQTIPLLKEATGRERHALRHVVSLEELAPQPGEMISYCLYADDRCPDGTLRRTHGDLFFAEVRPFDETFREGKSPPGGGGSSGGSQNPELEQFVQQQKQILQATWKLARESAEPIDPVRPANDPLTIPKRDDDVESLMKQRADDLTTIREAQHALVDPVRQFTEKLNNPRQKAAARTATTEMATASTRLESAKVTPHPSFEPHREALTQAIASEQTALQALMLLRAREHNVTQQSGGGGGGGGGASQQQLQQLELTNKQNRYQMQSEAKSPQEAARREQLQALNRLRELARRQADVNEKLRELDPKLRQPETETAEAEAKRQLKKLREEQEQLLRDVDELKSRMDRPENQQEMSDARQKLDDVRNRVRETSEALNQGKSSKSLSAGARAEKSLSELRDDLRKRTSSQFADAMRDLRNEARDVARQQEQVGQQLADTQKPAATNSRKSLRKEEASPQLAKDLVAQKERVEQLMENVRKTVEQAETSEPLLAKQLYDAVRSAREQSPSENLQKAAQFAGQNRLGEASTAERKAKAGVDQLESGIARAAEAILGDESEALRRARDELAGLRDSVRKELERKPKDDTKSGSSSSASSGPPNDRKPFQTADASGANDAGLPPKPDDGDSSRQGSNSPTKAGTTGSKVASNMDTDKPTQGKASRQSPRGKNSLAASEQEENGAKGERVAGVGAERRPKSNGSDASQQAAASGSQKSDSTGSPSSKGKSSSGASGNGSSPMQTAGNGNTSSPGDSESSSPGEGSSSASHSGKGLSGSKGSSQAGGRSPSPGQRMAQSPKGRGNNSSGQSGQSGGPGDGEEGLAAASSPITGDGFNEWSDRLRDVEEMLTDDRHKAEAARIRDRARSLRAEFKRHSIEPNRELLKSTVLEPLAELQRLVAADLARRESREALAPIDRDPVPEKYNDLVRRYYERLGQPERIASEREMR
ncbi:MAG: hypothetical protein IT428_24245 [Planctomycetaceae bacterium]|nr:hypothetical protein [Planctomycetaceae bacterium]